MKYKFGFIGCGNMGGALCSAVASKETEAKMIAEIEKLGCDVHL